MENNSFHQLWLEKLADLYSAEEQIANFLPDVIEVTMDYELKTAFEKHLIQTKEHINKLEELESKIGEDLPSIECKGIKAIIKEGEKQIMDQKQKEILDSVLIASAQQIEHYEICGYGTAIMWAQTMGHEDWAKVLKSIMEEEEETDEKLSELAENEINRRAFESGEVQ